MQDNELYHSLISKVAFTLGQNLLVNGRFLLKFFLFIKRPSLRRITPRPEMNALIIYLAGSGCGGTVGRAGASNIRDLQFKSRHWQFLFIVNCIQKKNLQIKRSRECHFK